MMKFTSKLMISWLFVIASFTTSAYTVDEAYSIASNYGEGFGNLIGVYDGNTNLDKLTNILTASGHIGSGTYLQQLAKSDEVSSDFLIDTLYFKDSDPSEAVIGTWDYTGGGFVDYLIVKASQQYAVYAYNSASSGGWSTLDILKTFGNVNDPYFAMSHLTAISAVPLPAAAPLFLSAIIIFGFLKVRLRNIKVRKSHLV